MKKSITLGILLLTGSLAHAGAAYSIFLTAERPEVEVCADKFGIDLTVNGVSEHLNRITLEYYETADRKMSVQRTPGYGLVLVDANGVSRLTKAGGGFGACAYREGIDDVN